MYRSSINVGVDCDFDEPADMDCQRTSGGFSDPLMDWVKNVTSVSVQIKSSRIMRMRTASTSETVLMDGAMRRCRSSSQRTIFHVRPAVSIILQKSVSLT